MLSNRVVMAPMTRARTADTIPDAQTARYYAQRASAGLIVSEGVPVSIEGRGFLFNPGLYSQAQMTGWRHVTEAVHAAGGRIFAQLWHVGRMSHVSLQQDGKPPVSSMAVQAQNCSAFAWQAPGVPGPVQASVPRALDAAEIPRIVEDFVHAARRAMEAGFDGVELHGANAYLFEQFINGALNQRTDTYGGSIANRLRLLLDTLDALSAAIGGHRVGVRISPFGRLYDMKAYPDEAEAWVFAARELNRRDLAYVHLSDQLTIGAESIPERFPLQFREAYRGTLIVAGGFSKDTAQAALERGDLDLVGFGRPFIANPDLVERMRNGWPIEVPDRSTYYGPYGEKGYIDYPAYVP